VKTIVNQPIPCPISTNCVRVEGYWIPRGELDIRSSDKYILTTSIRRNLKDIARIVSAGKLPVLIQGATSVGKTSLIQYLADSSGNQCYRINNHQHTDLQEYIGSYQSDKNGKLIFAEGFLRLVQHSLQN
jgi:midasin